MTYRWWIVAGVLLLVLWAVLLSPTGTAWAQQPPPPDGGEPDDGDDGDDGSPGILTILQNIVHTMIFPIESMTAALKKTIANIVSGAVEDAAAPFAEALEHVIFGGAADGPGEEMYGPAWRVFRNVSIALWPLTLGLIVATAARGGVTGNPVGLADLKEGLIEWVSSVVLTVASAYLIGLGLQLSRGVTQVILMQVWGADVVASPSSRTQAGREILEKDPSSLGSLGIAISEAVEDAATHEDTKYCLGSVLNHVLLHQTIVGLEAKLQLEKLGEYPDLLIGCVGGGSNFSGFAFPFVRDKLTGEKPDLRVIAVEPTACPTLTKGPYRYDFGDTAELTPLLKMFTLGHSFVPPGIHAGGLRYHGDAPLLCLLVDQKLIEARAYPQNSVFESALLFARTEGVVPAPETAHAIKAVVDEARRCKEEGKEEVIVFNYSGHGHFDLAAYDAYLGGKLQDFAYPQEEIEKALSTLPQM